MRIAIDTGGTFTDCIWVEQGQVRILKVFSTPDDPARAIVEAVRRIVGDRARDLLLLHGTTVGTNALLERKGGRVAFVTTEGFEDSIEIGRQARPKLYDLFFERVAPLVSADMRFGVPERTTFAGKIERRPEREALRALAETIAQAGPESIAVSLLFSFANPANERAVAAELEAVVNAPLSLSHVILPEFREYERASTVVVNAYLQPVMQRYLGRLEARVSGGGAGSDAVVSDRTIRRAGEARPVRIFVMQSSGGITSLESAAREPVRTVLSGPAGGVVGATAMGQRSGFKRIIGFDMGGTSTDVALVAGALHASNEAEIAGFPVRVPMLDIHTVGAGGGSIARFDAGGALRVGPASAGADPGPICYGRGEEPTVADANLLLGRLRPESFLGGTFTPDLERTRRLVSAWLSRNGSSLTVEDFAAGVVRVVNATMEKALRVVSVERGYDPRDFALVAFGGAGGLHACELAAALGIPRVVVPPMAGALSAYGILVSDVVKDYSRTVLLEGRSNGGAVRDEFLLLEKLAVQDFRDEGWRGRPRFQRSADLRYRGQGFELNLPVSAPMKPSSVGAVIAAFHDEHQRRYGYSHPERDVEVVTLRLRAVLPAPALSVDRHKPRTSSAKARRELVWWAGKARATDVYERERLRPGNRYSGPAIVTEYSATTAVPPGMQFSVDRAGALVVKTR